MLKPVNKKIQSDTTITSAVNEDSVNVTKITTKDSIHIKKDAIKDFKDSDAVRTDSISAGSEPVTKDSISITWDTTGAEQKVIKKLVRQQLPVTTKLRKTGYPPLDSVQSIPEASKNFLSRAKPNDTIYPRNKIFKLYSQIPATGYINKNIEPLKRIVTTNDWLLGIILFIVLLILWIKIFYKKYFAVLLNSLFSYQVSLKLFREKNILTKRVSFVLNFIYVIVLALYIHKILEFYHIKVFNFNTIETLLFLINLIIIISISRILLLNIIGLIFNNIDIFNEYIHNNYIINKNLGLFLFLLLITQIYMTEKISMILIFTGIISIILSHIMRLYRGFQIIIKKDVFLFYLILYLCTLEILPLLLGYKFFISLI